MPFEKDSPRKIKQANDYLRETRAVRPKVMTEVPYEEWSPVLKYDRGAPDRCWVSKEFGAQAFEGGTHYGIRCVRLSINRVELAPSGRWLDGLTWDDLMRVKRECGFGEWYAVEVLPPDDHIVNVANMRHIWLMESPLTIGWFKQCNE